MLAPVIVFAYNRANHLEKTLDAHSKNYLAIETDLFIFIDGPTKETEREKSEAVYQVAIKYSEAELFRKVVIERKTQNRGLANSIIGGVSTIISKYGKVIVVEDDLVSASDFLDFMNQGLDYYKSESRVGAISGFSPVRRSKPKCDNGIFISKTGNSCGWGTWEDRWEKVDWIIKDYACFISDKKKQEAFDSIQYGISIMLTRQMRGEIDSWAVRWDYFCFSNSLWTIYPEKSHICNVGFDGEGTNTNNKFEQRKRIVAQESDFNMAPIELLNDYTKMTASSFKPTFFEKLYDFLLKRGMLFF